MKNLNLIIVDDNKEFRSAAKELLETEFAAQVIAQASSGIEFLDLDNHHLADIIIMDLVMDGMDGIQATKNFLWRFPSAKVIAVTMHTDKAYLFQLLGAGFKGCIFKNNFFNEIKAAIEKVQTGKYYFPTEIKLS